MSDDLIKQSIRTIAGVDQMGNVSLVLCSVVSVNEANRTCTVTTISDEAETTIEDVKLMAEDDDGVLLLPATESTVIMAFSDKIEPFVMFYSEIQAVNIIAVNSSLDIREDKIKLNDGSYGGLIKIVDLVNRINSMENAYNELQAKFNAHTHAVSGGTASPTPNQSTSSVTNTTREQIENTTCVHGGSI